MSKRRAIGENVQAEVLVRSRRRCCLCAYLHGDFREKQGQIAHLDRNSANASLENLVFLCFDHHDRYDSSTRQSKGLTTTEVIRYRAKLYEWSGELDVANRSTTSRAHLLTLDIPWAFELYYPKLKLLFRVTPRIYDLLPDHKPNVSELDQAIEDPVHALKGCYQLLEAEEPRRDWEDNETYLSRCTLPKRCYACEKLILDVPPHFSALLHEDGEACIAVQISSLKLGVFKDIRRLISIGVPLAGRISVKNWNHPVNVSIRPNNSFNRTRK
jgi:hypothetical protein